MHLALEKVPETRDDGAAGLEFVGGCAGALENPRGGTNRGKWISQLVRQCCQKAILPCVRFPQTLFHLLPFGNISLRAEVRRGALVRHVHGLSDDLHPALAPVRKYQAPFESNSPTTFHTRADHSVERVAIFGMNHGRDTRRD
jgi:hypothetical protein